MAHMELNLFIWTPNQIKNIKDNIMKTIKLGLALLSVLLISEKASSQTKGCSSKLPADRVDHPSFIQDTANGRSLWDNYYLWDNGKTLYVKFMGGSLQMQEKVKAIAKEWEQYANIHFVFITVGASNIRINLDDKGGHNSMIGTLSNMASQDERTMNFDTTDFRTYAAMYRTVLHEFGHAIGFLHEHYSPLAGIPWNKEVVYAELKRTQGWDKATVDANLFQQFNISYTNGTKYDRASIMHYPVLARWTTTGYSVDWNNKLSEGDIAMAGIAYPKNGDRIAEVPRFTIENYTKMEVVRNSAKQGFSLFPSFNITTAGKQGMVYFIAFFYDKDGNPIRKETESYAINNVAATFKSFTIGAGKKMSANKLSPNDFEMFIPYSELPVPTGNNNVRVEFRAYVMDKKADGTTELKMIYASKPVFSSFMKKA
jgi:serralysin